MKQHEADLKRLGVDHLYMFGSTARGDAKEDSDVDLFFDHEKGKLGLYELMDVKREGARRQHPRSQGRHHDAQQPASPSKSANRKICRSRVLMVERIISPRLADIIEAVERIGRVLEGVPLDAFEQDWEKRWLVERGIEIISEASRHLSDDMKTRQAGIPWSKVAGIGNVLRHDYDQVAPDVLWKLARDDLPLLCQVCREELIAALAREEGD